LPSSLSAHTTVSIPVLDAFQRQLTPLNSTPTFARIERPLDASANATVHGGFNLADQARIMMANIQMTAQLAQLAAMSRGAAPALSAPAGEGPGFGATAAAATAAAAPAFFGGGGGAAAAAASPPASQNASTHGENHFLSHAHAQMMAATFAAAAAADGGRRVLYTGSHTTTSAW
jgi:hypothetical protein